MKIERIKPGVYRFTDPDTPNRAIKVYRDTPAPGWRVQVEGGHVWPLSFRTLERAGRLAEAWFKVGLPPSREDRA